MADALRCALIVAAWVIPPETDVPLAAMLRDWWEEAERYGWENLKALQANPWCGLCGSRELAWEHRETAYQDMRDALPMLKELEVANARARQLFGNRFN